MATQYLFAMIKITVKILGIIVPSLIVVALAVYGYSFIDIKMRAGKTYEVAAEPITIIDDSSAIALGERLSLTRACQECHGTNLGGSVLIDDPVIGRFSTRNITKGKGGLPQDFSKNDWLLAIKHGLNREHKPLYLMPSHELSQLSESDIAALIAYCSQVPPVDNEPPSFRIGPLGYVLAEFGLIPLLPAELTNHTIPFAQPVLREVSVEYGKYLSTICINCHGPNLKGGESPVPGGKYVADITSSGNPGKWTHEQFIKTLHTGETPEGKQMKPEEMPWTITKNYTVDELTAMHLYLLTLK
jgi:mono/diheme cytochrome c family protein